MHFSHFCQAKGLIDAKAQSSGNGIEYYSVAQVMQFCLAEGPDSPAKCVWGEGQHGQPGS